MDIPVLLPKIFNYPLTYGKGNIKSLSIGDIVEVPFGNKTEIGVVWNKQQTTSKKFKIKLVKKRFENLSINENLVHFINWFSSYNLVSKGLVLKMCISNKKVFFKEESSYKESKILNKGKLFELNHDQKKSLSDLERFGNNFSVSVLQGVTGSGKTLVYFEKKKKFLKLTNKFLLCSQKYF